MCKSLALSWLVPASQTLLIPDLRPLVERLGSDFFRQLAVTKSPRPGWQEFGPGAEKPIGPDAPLFPEEDWIELSPQFQAVSEAYNWYNLDELRHSVSVFAALYNDHIGLEETLVYPEARRLAGHKLD